MKLQKVQHKPETENSHLQSKAFALLLQPECFKICSFYFEGEH